MSLRLRNSDSILQDNTVLDTAPFTPAVDCFSLHLSRLDNLMVTCMCV